MRAPTAGATRASAAAGAVVDAAIVAGAGAGAGADAEVDADADAGADASAEVDTEAEADAGAEVGTEADAEAGAEAGTVRSARPWRTSGIRNAAPSTSKLATTASTATALKEMARRPAIPSRTRLRRLSNGSRQRKALMAETKVPAPVFVVVFNMLW
jgi:hypothetical protein